MPNNPEMYLLKGINERARVGRLDGLVDRRSVIGDEKNEVWAAQAYSYF